MQEIRETYESEITIEESKDKHILGYLEFIGAKADFKNSNHRTYTKATLEKAVKEFNARIEKKNISGILSNLDHAMEAYPNLSKGSHIINKLWMDGDLLRGQAAILNTQAGKDLRTILKSGVGIGISMKGTGNIDKNGFIDKNSFELLSLDVVNRPAFGDITKLTDANLFESVNNIIEGEEFVSFKEEFASIRTTLDKAVAAKFPNSYVTDFSDKEVIIAYDKDAPQGASYETGKYLKVTYKIGNTGEISFGTPKEVEKKISYEKISAAEFSQMVEKQLRHQFEISFPDVNWNRKNIQDAFEKYSNKNWASIAEQIEKILRESKRTVENSVIQKSAPTEEMKLNWLYEEYLQSLSNFQKPKTFSEFKEFRDKK